MTPGKTKLELLSEAFRELLKALKGNDYLYEKALDNYLAILYNRNE